ncbi:hypothetical protein SASPL_145173 [Salvia splendens]|uniref:Uncharacterized protein n=1 Tax=Salvia splendens TaxID=180675 RepID=A0A8X8WID8_SALSN|nr:hypothetical protein SASPL_145173 [Salvia splendens]
MPPVNQLELLSILPEDELPVGLPYSQHRYLYSGGWTDDDEKLLLDLMIKAKEKAKAAGGREDFSDAFICMAYDLLKDKFEFCYFKRDTKESIAFLEERYKSFKFADDLVVAYYLRDEPEYAKLSRIFRPDDDDNDGECGPSRAGYARLIDTLMHLKHESDWKVVEFPPYFFTIAAAQIHAWCGEVFTYPDVVNRVGFLTLRYQTFNDLIKTKATYWDRVDQFVHTANCIWSNPFEAAYNYHDEPEFNRLRSQLYYMVVDADEEEVNSHVVVPKLSACRKLVFDEGTSTDRLSTTPPGVLPFVDVTEGNFHSSSQQNRRLPHAHHGMNISRGQTTQMSPFGSSCASNSPLGVWRQVRM